MNRRFALVFALAAASGCARVSSALDDNLGAGAGVDLATPGASPDSPDLADDGSPADMAVVPPDLALGPDLATASDLAVPADLATPRDLAAPRDLTPPPDLVVVTNCHVVINEVQTGTTQTGTEEFIELYNPCTAAVAVDNFKLVYRSASNTNARTGADSSTLISALTGSIAAGGYRVYGGIGFTGSATATFTNGIAASGAVGLRDATGALVDSVAYGTVAAGNTFIETAAAPTPPTVASPGGSIERLPNGTDSDDNSHDFTATNTSTPGAANH